MTKEEIQASIKSIMFSGAVCGIEIYASLRNENGYHTKKMRATDKLLSSTKDKVAENADDTIDAIVRASFSMGRAKTGALIVIEQKFVLNEYIATGILLDAIVSAPLLVQIFEHNLPLHDGAVVIRGNRITAATCYLPLSENKTISKELGTRHRAGLGISEVTDALTVIVSEETGQVSLTKDGQLYRNVNSDKLRELLGGTKSSEKTQTVWDRLRKGRKRHEK